jgi:hypothetical protein
MGMFDSVTDNFPCPRCGSPVEDQEAQYKLYFEGFSPDLRVTGVGECVKDLPRIPQLETLGCCHCRSCDHFFDVILRFEHGRYASWRPYDPDGEDGPCPLPTPGKKKAERREAIRRERSQRFKVEVAVRQTELLGREPTSEELLGALLVSPLRRRIDYVSFGRELRDAMLAPDAAIGNYEKRGGQWRRVENPRWSGMSLPPMREPTGLLFFTDFVDKERVE